MRARVYIRARQHARFHLVNDVLVRQRVEVKGFSMCTNMQCMRKSPLRIKETIHIDPTRRPPPDFTRCGKCEECIRDAINDRVGRSMAQTTTHPDFFSICLTYDPDLCVDARGIDHSKVAVKEDVTGLIKRLRTAGFPLKFLYVFEAGSEKGRQHIHLLIWFTSKRVPDFKIGRKAWRWSKWPWGITYVQNGDGRASRYITKMMKYTQKSFASGEGDKPVWGMSRRLGEDFFKALAADYVQRGLCPEFMTYTVPGCVLENGQPWQFRMFDLSLEIFQKEFDRLFQEKRPGRDFPKSDRMAKGRHARAYTAWAKPYKDYNKRLEAAFIANAKLSDDDEPVVVETLKVEDLGPPPVIAGYVRRTWADAMPGAPFDETDPNSEERRAARSRRLKHRPSTFQKPYEEPVPFSTRPAPRVRGREAGDLIINLPRRF